MAPVIDAPPPAPLRAARPRRRSLIVAGLLLALLAAWQLVGHHPSVDAGSTFGPDDGVTVTNDVVPRLVIEAAPDSTHTVVVSVRNGGAFPVTITGAGDEVMNVRSDDGTKTVSAIPVFEQETFALAPVQGGSVPADEISAPSVTVPPDREAMIRLYVHIPHCALLFEPGSSLSFSVVRLHVSQLGVSTVQQPHVFPEPLTIVAGPVPAGCS